MLLLRLTRLAKTGRARSLVIPTHPLPQVKTTIKPPKHNNYPHTSNIIIDINHGKGTLVTSQQ